MIIIFFIFDLMISYVEKLDQKNYYYNSTYNHV